MKWIALALVIAWSTSAPADDAPRPPSKTLERAIKWYDKQDFYSASVELEKVIAGETGDDDVNKQRAEFFKAKTLYQLGFYVPSLAAFGTIAKAGPAHRYQNASLKWLAALAKLVDVDNVAAIVGTYDAADLADPALESVRFELTYLLALQRMRVPRRDQAAALLDGIPKSSAVYARARLALGYALFFEDAKAIAAWANVPAGDEADRAALAIGEAHLHGKAWDKAIAAFAKIDRGHVLGPRAAWEASWAAQRKRDAKLDEAVDRVVWSRALAHDAIEPSSGILAVATAHVCSGVAKADDVLAQFRAKPAAIADELAGVLAANDDNADFVANVAIPIRRGGLQLAADTRAVAQAALAGPTVSAALARMDELDRELALLAKSDRAWQATHVAGDILQELTISRSIETADAGIIARGRVQHVIDDLRRLAHQLPAAKLPLAVTCAKP